MVKEEVIFQGAANMQYQGVGSVLGHNKGGQLTLTDKRLIFKAHVLNIGQKEYVVPLQNIKFAQDTFHILTPTPNMIQVELQSGEVYKFVVKGKEKDTWKNLIMEYAKKARNQVNVETTGTENVRFCSNCGGQITVGAKFCAKCGSPI